MNQNKLFERLRAVLLAFLLLPDCGGSFTWKLPMQDITVAHFSGEHVRLSTACGSIEQQMLGVSAGQLALLQSRFDITATWSTEDGTEIGQADNLQQLTPAESKTYRLSVTISPKSGETGTQPQEVLFEQTASYTVAVVSGTIAVKVRAEKKVIKESDALHFVAAKTSGERFFCTAVPEMDPETGVWFLAGEMTQLPYGTYTVCPVRQQAALYCEASQTCCLGVWEQDDTVSPHRANAQVEFTLL